MSNSIKIALFFALSVACFAQPGPRPSGGGGSSGVTSFNTRTGAVVSVSGDVTSALGFTPLTPTVSTNAALKAALDATNNLGASAFTALSFQTNVATKAAQDATNGLGSAAFSASGAFQAALGFTPLTPTVSTNAALKAAQDATNGLGASAFTALSFQTNVATKTAQDATNGLGSAAFTASGAYQAALGFTPLTPAVSTNAAVKAAQDATNGLSSGAFAAAGASAAEAYITIANTAGLSAERALAGTANQITLTDGGANGSLTLSLPQNIHTAATPQFARMGLGSAAASTTELLETMAIATGTTSYGTDMTNSTVATVGAQAQSPWLHWGANGWKTTSTAGSQPVEFRAGLIPVQSATSPNGYLRFESSTNNSAFGRPFDFSTEGWQTNAQGIAWGTVGGSAAAFFTPANGGNNIGMNSGASGSVGFTVTALFFNIGGGLQLDTTGIFPLTDNSKDLGSNGSARFRRLYIGTAITNDTQFATGAGMTFPAGPAGTLNGAASADMVIAAPQSDGTGRAGAMIHMTANSTASSSTANAPMIRSYIAAKHVALTHTTATLVFNVTVASGKTVGFHCGATTLSTDGTDRQATRDDFDVVAVNKAGTVSTGITSSPLTATVSTSGTLTTVWTAVANGNSVDIKCQATSTVITPTTLQTRWRIESDGDDFPSVTPQ